MKKLLTVTLVLVFAVALVLALGCTKKAEQTGMEGQGTMEQTPASGGTEAGTTDTTGHQMAAPESAMGGGN
jgi:hypothetical protein